MAPAGVVIVGAGAAGLAAAGALKQRGIASIVLDQDAQIGGTWARRYDRLRLHTVREFSGLPGLPLPRGSSSYASRDEYVAYLRDYARHFALDVRTGFPIQRIEVRPEGASTRVEWLASGSAGEVSASVVVVAVGQYRLPQIPAWPGRAEFRGTLIHSVDYRNAQPFVGKRVLVVGAGNSGAEIATDLIEQGAAFVAIAVRTPPAIVPRDPFGRPIQRTGMLMSHLPPRIADRLARLTARLVLGDLTRHGFPQAEWRPYSTVTVPVIDVGFVDMLKRRRVQVRRELVRLTPSDAIFADGGSEPFDAIVAATGFASGLDALLADRSLLDEASEPRGHSGEPTRQPGLYFIGYTHSLRGHLFEANRDAMKLAENVAHYLSAA
ncbi:MAG: NAD(P)/FAD-dependent oxidoreductase [Rudaea sp.]